MKYTVKLLTIIALLVFVSGCKKKEQTADPVIPTPTVSGNINGHDYVDLGLPSGLKWATCNVGAASSSDYGDYFAWGETETKSTFTQDNCTTLYQNIGDISGNAQYDVARKKWGGTWRIPKKSELEELKDKCTWTWTNQDGHNGYKITGTNGNYIFLPAAGDRYGSWLNFEGERGYLWSSTPEEGTTQRSYFLYFRGGYNLTNWYNRDYGRSVRPVAN